MCTSVDAYSSLLLLCLPYCLVVYPGTFTCTVRPTGPLFEAPIIVQFFVEWSNVLSWSSECLDSIKVTGKHFVGEVVVVSELSC